MLISDGSINGTLLQPSVDRVCLTCRCPFLTVVLAAAAMLGYVDAIPSLGRLYQAQ